MKKDNETFHLLTYDNIKRPLELNKEKGAGSGLTAFLLNCYGYSLNKHVFMNAMCLRYGWKIANTP